MRRVVGWAVLLGAGALAAWLILQAVPRESATSGRVPPIGSVVRADKGDRLILAGRLRAQGDTLYLEARIIDQRPGAIRAPADRCGRAARAWLISPGGGGSGGQLIALRPPAICVRAGAKVVIRRGETRVERWVFPGGAIQRSASVLLAFRGIVVVLPVWPLAYFAPRGRPA